MLFIIYFKMYQAIVQKNIFWAIFLKTDILFYKNRKIQENNFKLKLIRIVFLHLLYFDFIHYSPVCYIFMVNNNLFNPTNSRECPIINDNPTQNIKSYFLAFMKIHKTVKLCQNIIKYQFTQHLFGIIRSKILANMQIFTQVIIIKKINKQIRAQYTYYKLCPKQLCILHGHTEFTLINTSTYFLISI